jgi:hypothetical protein
MQTCRRFAHVADGGGTRNAAKVPTDKLIQQQRARARRELEQDRRRKDRESLRRLREHAKHARGLKRSRMREVMTACKQARVRLKTERQALRARYAAGLAAAEERNRLASRRNCDAKKQRARTHGEHRISRAAAALAAERAHQAHARIWSRPSRNTQPTAARRATAIQESDSGVESNLPEDLIRVWRAVRTRIKGSAYRTRTEAFLEWVAEHRGEVQRIVDQHIDREVAELVRHEAELRKRVASPHAYRRMTNAQLLEDVPF